MQKIYAAPPLTGGLRALSLQQGTLLEIDMPVGLVALIAALVIVICAVAFAWKLARRQPKAHLWPVTARAPVSLIEQQVYRRLSEAYPEHIVLCQMALSQLVKVDRGKGNRNVFDRISPLVVDFVLCSADFKVIGILDLDDSLHQPPDRQRAERNKTDALAAAGYPLVRFTATKLPSVAELRLSFIDAVTRARARAR